MSDRNKNYDHEPPGVTGGSAVSEPVRGVCAFSTAFNHYAHVRLAYVYLCENELESAHQRMRQSLQAFLAHHGADASKYHETMTRAWMMAVRHFMAHPPDAGSAAAFIERNPKLLDSRIMLAHYSEEVLFSDEARSTFIEPDLNPIPEQGL